MERTTTDKYNRALPVVAEWDRIYFSENIPADVIEEIQTFSGTKADLHDDCVDSVVTGILNCSSNINQLSYFDAVAQFDFSKRRYDDD